MPSRRASTGCSGRPFQVASRLLAGESGQGTVEYAVVAAAFLGIVVGLGALWHSLDAALPVQHALQSASHHVAAVAPGAFSDVFMY